MVAGFVLAGALVAFSFPFLYTRSGAKVRQFYSKQSPITALAQHTGIDLFLSGNPEHTAPVPSLVACHVFHPDPNRRPCLNQFDFTPLVHLLRFSTDRKSLCRNKPVDQ